MLSLLGSTPVLSLNGLTSPLLGMDAPEIYVKLESTNPGWSVKARPAMHMLEQAERRGEIGPDTVIVESSSGDTAIAMAMVSAMKGYRFKPMFETRPLCPGQSFRSGRLAGAVRTFPPGRPPCPKLSVRTLPPEPNP